MPLRLVRRTVLALPLLLAACGDDDAPAPVIRRGFPPLRYGYLPPIPLNVERVQMAEGFIPPSGDDEVGGSSPVDFAETLFAMARDRLKPVAPSGTATFRILKASVVRHRDTLSGVLEVRLDVSDADGTSTGFAEARATAAHSGPISDQRAAVYDMLKSMMDDMNVELEYQIRNKLRAWVVDTTATPAPAPPRPAPAPASEPLPVPPDPPMTEPPSDPPRF
jgi:hypothetical protein